MAICRTEGVVVRRFDFGNTSLIAEFFTRGFGRISGILKGIRADPKKFASYPEIFSRQEIIFYPTRNSSLHLVSQCDIKDGFWGIRDNLERIEAAGVLVSLVRALFAPEDKNDAAFGLIVSCLNDLSSVRDAAKMVNIARIKLLRLSGFRPHFDSCVVCGADIRSRARFSAAFGGLLCPECLPRDRAARLVSPGTVASIRHIQIAPWEDSRRLFFSPTVNRELIGILQRFIDFHIDL
ncbi:MAG: DNA repair protein RecO [Candidatus Omnitrophota bacterium]